MPQPSAVINVRDLRGSEHFVEARLLDIEDFSLRAGSLGCADRRPCFAEPPRNRPQPKQSRRARDLFPDSRRSLPGSQQYPARPCGSHLARLRALRGIRA